MSFVEVELEDDPSEKHSPPVTYGYERSPVTLRFDSSILEQEYQDSTSRSVLQQTQLLLLFLVPYFVALFLVHIVTDVFLQIEAILCLALAALAVCSLALLHVFQKNYRLCASYLMKLWHAALAIFQITFLTLEAVASASFCAPTVQFWGIHLIVFPLAFTELLNASFVASSLHALANAVAFSCLESIPGIDHTHWLYAAFCLGYPFIFYFSENFKRNQFLKWKMSEENLRNAREDAERTNMFKRKFLSYIFHEIRVPINAVAMGVDILGTESPDTKEQNEIVAMLRTQIEAVVHILDDVLSLEKIEQGKLQIQAKSFNIRKLIKQTTWSFSKVFEEKNIALSLDLLGSPKTVVADEFRIQQVVSNFLSNAIKFTAEKGKISVSCKSLTDGRIQVSVSDTGVGIPAADHDQLFKPFVQISAGELQKGRGTGLGLSICRSLIHLHGGSIGFRSKLNMGSEFFFKIPIGQKDPESDHSSTADVKAEAKDGGDLQEGDLPQIPEAVKSVLIVEDSVPNSKLLAKMFRTMNFQCSFAANGKEAVDLFSRLSLVSSVRFDVVIMDKEMPVMHGDEAIRQIRMLGFDEVPIIALTGNAFEDEKLKLLDAGASAFLSKPTSFDKIKKTLQELHVLSHR